MVQPPWKRVQQFLEKLKIKLPYDPTIQLLGMYPKELKEGSRQDICTPCSQQHCSQQPKGRNNPSVQMSIFFKPIYLFIYLLLLFFLVSALCLRCCARAFSSCGEQGLLFVVVHGLLTEVASLRCRAQALDARASVVWLTGSRVQAQQLWLTGLVAPWHVEIGRAHV